MTDNVIHVDFKAADPDGHEALKASLCETYAMVARARGYGADRAAEVAAIVFETAVEMQSVSLKVSIEVDLNDLRGSVERIMQQAAAQAVHQCIDKMGRAAFELCYPVQR